MKFSYSMIVSDRFDTTDFDERRQLFEMFDVRGTLALENEEKVVNVSCLISPQPVSLALTSHLLNTGETGTLSCVCRLMDPFQ